MTNILRYDKMGKLINVGILSLYYTSRWMGNIIQPIIEYHIAPGTLIKVGKVYMVAGKNGLQSKMSEYSYHVSLMAIVPNIQ